MKQGLTKVEKQIKELLIKAAIIVIGSAVVYCAAWFLINNVFAHMFGGN